MKNKETTSLVDWERFKEEYENYEKANGACPHCGRCPTCGRLLWPTPHGLEPCHPITFAPYPRESRRGVYTDEMGFFVAID